MKATLKPPGDSVEVFGHNIHVYRCGKENAVKLVFMAGSGTVAPVYDFKCLYEKLKDDFRIIVIEKPGYGYSDCFNVSCNIDSLVYLQRQALSLLDEYGPYVLLPHSMSGLEAIRWKQLYPDEVGAIIGIDMGNPFTYDSWSQKDVRGRIRMMHVFRKTGIHHLLHIPPLYTQSLSEDEILQQQLLRKRNAFNECYCREAACVKDNAEIVRMAGDINGPVLLFVSDGKQNSANWVGNQRKFSESTNAKLIQFDCSHYMHHDKSEEITKEIKAFLRR